MITPRILALWVAAAMIGASSSAVPIGTVPLPALANLRADNPELLIPGSSHLLLDTDPAGYVICTSVMRYFDDEAVSDLQTELDLAARQQFVRFLLAGVSDERDDSRQQVVLGGFQQHAAWWEGNALHGLYFLPAEGISQVPTPPRGAESTKTNDPEDAATAASLLLEGRRMRKHGDLAAARTVFEKLRSGYPLTAASRRALHEIYLVNAAEKEKRMRDKGSVP